MKKEIKLPFILFLLGILCSFGFLCLLQFVTFPLFILVLLCMHGGIVLFIVSKKKFKKAGISPSLYYKREYLMLSLFLPILLYKLLGRLGLYEVNVPVKTYIAVGVTVLCLLASAYNALLFYRQLTGSCEK